jgi:hypothetical protein
MLSELHHCICAQQHNPQRQRLKAPQAAALLSHAGEFVLGLGKERFELWNRELEHTEIN